MKLLGYNRVKGEKNGNEYDFMQLVLEKSNERVGANCGGSQIYLSYSKNRGNYLPTVNTDVFTQALQRGLKVGSEINIYRDLNGEMVIDIK